MTPIAPLISSFLSEHMPIAQGCSPHTCETYAHAFRLLFIFASKRLGIRPSQICLEQIDAALILEFLAHIEEERGKARPHATDDSPLSKPSSGMSSSGCRPPWHRHDRSTPSRANAITRHLYGISPWKKCAPSSRRTKSHNETRHSGPCDVAPSVSRQACASRNWSGFCWRTSPYSQRRAFAFSARDARNGAFRSGRKLLPTSAPGWQYAVPVPELFVNAEAAAMTRAGFEYILDTHVCAATKSCSSLSGRSVSPHQLRHYLPFRTMSGNGEPLPIWPGNSRSRQGKPGVAIATRQKTTLSRCGIGLSQRTKAFAIKFAFDVKAILPIGVDVRVACRRQMHHICVIDVMAFGSQLI
jgi:integrase/recombinase XerD